MSCFALTDKGPVRQNNEDYVKAFTLSNSSCSPGYQCTVLLLADGMGGAEGGECASSIAVEGVAASIAEDFSNFTSEDFHSSDKTLLLEKHVKEVNRLIYSKSRLDYSLRGMGSTLVTGFISDKNLALTHTGDSRAYKYSKGSLHRLTKDHSIVQELVSLGVLTEEEARVHPKRNVITKAVGVSPVLDVDKQNIAVYQGDIILFCSDGLCGYVTDSEIEASIKDTYAEQNVNLQEMAQKLLELAYKNGTKDNVSLCLYQHAN